MRDHFWWYLARGSGIVSWLLLTAAVIWGILVPAKLTPPGVKRRPAWILDLHRWLGALTIWFLALHLVALVADSYTEFTLADLAIPFVSSWKPGAVALGVISMWLLLAVEISSLMMKRIPKVWWRRIHLTSYAAFWLTGLHGILAGTDAANPLYVATSALAIVLVVVTLVYRILTRRDPAGSRSRPTPDKKEAVHGT